MKKLFVFLSIALIQFSIKAQPCSDLFFSEYIEGSGQNKALEIYNPTSAPVDLSNYTLYRANGGAAQAQDTLVLFGNLNAGDVYVVANASAGNDITAVADTTSTITFYNGDDAVWLVNNTSNTILDIIGEIGNDPGSAWAVGSGETQENTLVRKMSVQSGTTDWNLSSTQWDVYPQDDFSYIGSHSMTPCGPITDTLVNFSGTATSVEANQGSVNIGLNLNAISASSNFTADVVLQSGDTADISGFSSETVNFTSMNEQVTISIAANLDTISSSRSYVFKLRNATSNLQLGTDTTFTLTITPVTQTLAYTIADVRGNNVNGAPDSVGLVCQLSGTVIGPNFLPSGLQFTLNDGTAGISVRIPGKNFGYTVTEGDSVSLIGEVSQFRGQGQMEFLDTVYYVAPGRNISPFNVTTLDESTEGELVRMENVEITDVFNGAAGTTYDARLNGFEFEIYIDADVISANDDPIAGNSQLISVVGIGGQFAFSAPYTDGYQITPRKVSDIEVDPSNSVAELENGISNVYPNPAQSSLFIQLENGINAEQVMVFDITGKNVSNKIASEINSGNISLDISSLQNGSYIAQIRTKDSTIQAKFMIAK